MHRLELERIKFKGTNSIRNITTIVAFKAYEINKSSFRRLTLLASPTPKYCFKGVGEAGPKNEGEAEIEFLINFHTIFYF